MASPWPLSSASRPQNAPGVSTKQMTGRANSLREVDAGHIGNYDSCMSSSEVTGYWRPLEGCNPYIGNEGEISKEPEIKVEVTVFTEAVDRTIEAIKKVHPYEEPVINAIPILRTSF